MEIQYSNIAGRFEDDFKTQLEKLKEAQKAAILRQQEQKNVVLQLSQKAETKKRKKTLQQKEIEELRILQKQIADAQKAAEAAAAAQIKAINEQNALIKAAANAAAIAAANAKTETERAAADAAAKVAEKAKIDAEINQNAVPILAPETNQNTENKDSFFTKNKIIIISTILIGGVLFLFRKKIF
jgi:membrane protein involved in colicin uptake